MKIIKRNIILFIIFLILLYKFYPKQNLNMCFFNGKYSKSFINLSKINNKTIILEEKEEILKYISLCNKRKIFSIKKILLNCNCRFGNKLILLNKAIFYCQIIGCKKIILNKNLFWFIRNKIRFKRYKISIEVDEENYYNNTNTLIDNTNFFFWFFKYIFPQYKTEIIKIEILKNLPQIKINSNELYIFIRSGDIFKKSKLYYFQPPSCFYKCIINNFKFKNIYLIAQNSNNPVINQILFKFPNIIYNKNNLKYDISYLIYAYNIVGAYSTFLKNIILLNDNVKLFYLFEFFVSLIYSFFFSYEFNHKNVSVLMMKANNYYNKIRDSKTFKEQIDLMLKYKCKSNFKILN